MRTRWASADGAGVSPTCALILLVIPQSRSDIRDPMSSCSHVAKGTGLTRRIPRLALRAIGCADVRFGILPPQSGSAARSRGGPGM